MTAATGADVLGHAVEAYVGRRANPVTDTLALDAAARAWHHLPRATRQGDDLAARQEMLLASALAGWAFDQSGLGIIHALAGPLSARYALHHGLCIGLLLPHGLAYNLPALGDKRAGLLRALDMAPDLSDDAVIDRIKAWLQGLGLPGSLREVSTVWTSAGSRRPTWPRWARPRPAWRCCRTTRGPPPRRSVLEFWRVSCETTAHRSDTPAGDHGNLG